VKRAEEELEKHRDELYTAQTKVRALEAQVKDQQRKYADLEGRVRSSNHCLKNPFALFNPDLERETNF
jgi:predicted  nucleic acid-binding Zn-ribbon protein